MKARRFLIVTALVATALGCSGGESDTGTPSKDSSTSSAPASAANPVDACEIFRVSYEIAPARATNEDWSKALEDLQQLPDLVQPEVADDARDYVKYFATRVDIRTRFDSWEAMKDDSVWMAKWNAVTRNYSPGYRDTAPIVEWYRRWCQ